MTCRQGDACLIRPSMTVAAQATLDGSTNYPRTLSLLMVRPVLACRLGMSSSSECLQGRSVHTNLAKAGNQRRPRAPRAAPLDHPLGLVEVLLSLQHTLCERRRENKTASSIPLCLVQQSSCMRVHRCVQGKTALPQPEGGKCTISMSPCPGLFQPLLALQCATRPS